MAKIGTLKKPTKTDSKFSLTGVIYFLGIPVSIGLKKTEKGYDIESFGLIGVEKTKYNINNNSTEITDTI